jgi:SNF2 family DNA or RNA helicase
VEANHPKFQIGSKVSLVGQNKLLGVIINNKIVGSAFYCDVFISENNIQTFPQDNLELFQPRKILGSYHDLLRDLAVRKIQKNQSDHLYSLYASRTRFEVYQYRPAIKFLSNSNQRLLIADEVGLGKTIEAGIIYLELKARLQIKRILVVCPSVLRKKWQDEMKFRFDEEFLILDSNEIKDKLIIYQKSGDEFSFRWIVSLETIRRDEIAEKFKDVMLDLLIVDEAHHCRNPQTLSHDIVSMLAENSDATLLLTATPLQTGLNDLFSLLRILNPGEFDNYDSFIQRLEPNKYINQAAMYLSQNQPAKALEELRKVEKLSFGKYFLKNPYYVEVKNTLTNENLDREQTVRTQLRLMQLNTLSNIFTRTKKREVTEFAVRKPFVINVKQTPTEQVFYESVLDLVRFFYRKGAPGWSGIMRERQAASCLPAFRDKILKGEVFGDDDFENNSNNDLIDLISYNILIDEKPLKISFHSRSQQKAIEKRKTLFEIGKLFNTDSKFEQFYHSVKKILDEERDTKILVFSFFRDTVNYLYSKLESRGIPCLKMHGAFSVLERKKIVDRFQDSNIERILVTSDVGAEGLDFQYCEVLFNYDLPWNPMKVEQRIGRIDRFGQKAPVIRIYNLVLENTIEERILYRLFERINLFRESIGDIEEILGEEINQLVDYIFSNQLTPQEELQQLDERLKIIERRKVEIEQFEENKHQFLGQESIFESAVKHKIESGKYVSPRELFELVNSYIREVDQYSRIEDNDENGKSYLLFLGHKLKDKIRTFLENKNNLSRCGMDFRKTLVEHQSGDIPITFLQEVAFERKLIEFITIRHPLAVMAFDYWNEKISQEQKLYCFTLHDEKFPKGRYFFFLYILEATGINSETSLIPVVIQENSQSVMEDMSKEFLNLIQNKNASPLTINRDEIDIIMHYSEQKAEQWISRKRTDKESELNKNNQQIIQIRITSITQSYENKKKSVERRLNSAKNLQIKRMYEGQLRNMEYRYKAKIEELQAKDQVNVSYSKIMEGVFLIQP